MLKVFYAIIMIFLNVFSPVYAQQNLQAWYTQGQTFLVWQHSGSVPQDTTYEIYTGAQPITSINNAIWIGRVFAANGANFRIHEHVPGAQWKLPDTSGGTVSVDTNEAYFVITPHAPGTAYYAVVLFGDTIVGPENTTGPIIETIDSIACVMQYQDDTVTIYGHWIDGRQDYDSGHQDYPIMGNEYSNGIGFNLAVWKPQRTKSQRDLPMVIVLHGGYSNLIQVGIFRYLLSDGFMVTLDDGLTVDSIFGSGTVEINTFWTGYNNEFNRFFIIYPSDSATVVNYTARRIWWETEWLINNQSLDSHRVSLMGISMGAIGTLLHTQLKPDMFSAGLAYVPILRGIKEILKPERVFLIFGDTLQNLLTNFDGQPGIYDILDQKWRLGQSHPDWPFAVIISGKNDTQAVWFEKPEVYRHLDSAKTGFALYWDEREHIDWSGAHFRFSEHVTPNYLTRFRNDQSFPAFSGTDLDLVTPGQQPDPGNGDPMDGDSWGTWGGYLKWDTTGIVDNTDEWAVTVWVVYQSIFPNDIPDADTILANVTPFRLQQFSPQPGHLYSWNLTRVSTDDTLQEGIIIADPSGIITIPDLLLIKEPFRLTIWGPVGVTESHDDISSISISSLQVFPNPFTEKTEIAYSVGRRAKDEGRNAEGVECRALDVYDITGRLVKSFSLPADYFILPTVISWDGTDNFGQKLPTGVYFLRLNTKECSAIKKCVYLK